MKPILFLPVLSVLATHKDPYWADNRNSIVHLFEWKFLDIAKECEQFLAPNGYAGVQTSPVNENLVAPNRPWWERYQPMSYKIISRSGNEDEFKDMVRRCADVGVRIYVDVVFNHMTGNWNPAIGTGNSTADTNNKEYPAVPYGSNEFHSSCQIDNYNDAYNVRNCELSGLHDLNQTTDSVRNKIVDFLNHLIHLGVAGFRVDACKHMWPEDLQYIYSQLDNLNSNFGFAADSKPFIYQEVIDLGGEAVSREEYTSFGVVTEFRFSASIGNVFRGNVWLRNLSNWGPEWGFMNSSEALAFVDNHDNQRGHGAGGDTILTYKTPKQYIMAVAFTLSYGYGITRVMSSYNFTDSDQGPPHDDNGNILSPQFNSDGECTNGWVCEHRWRQISHMIGFNNEVGGTNISNWWDDGYQQIAFGRGNKGYIAFTNGGNLTGWFITSLPQGEYCDIISGSLNGDTCTGKSVKVDDYGNTYIELLETDEDGVFAIHKGSKLQ